MKIKQLLSIALFVVSSFIGSKAAAQGMAVNTDGTAANASAMLDVKSTTQGVLVPRMTSAQRTAITSAAQGLLVFQTDGTAGFYYYNSGWTALSGGGSSSSSLQYVGKPASVANPANTTYFFANYTSSTNAGGQMNNTTGAFTAAADGVYMISFSATFSLAVTCPGGVDVNGTKVAFIGNGGGSTSFMGTTYVNGGTVSVNVVAGDVIKVFLFANNAATITPGTVVITKL